MNTSGRELFGNQHSKHKTVGAGKGDKSRHVFNEDWRRRYSEIDFSGPQIGFERVGVKEIKRYGPADPAKLTIESLTPSKETSEIQNLMNNLFAPRRVW